MYKLAIVIPAYKGKFFDQALLSIANQTSNRFTLYIGDDCSPDDLFSIAKKYYERISIVYKHFNENLGGKNLVAQWERCIDLIKDEEWIWLFSDDDIMDSNCVERFYTSLEQTPDFDLFKFNLNQIDELGNIIGKSDIKGEIISSEEFLKYRLRRGSISYVVEYIFRKSHFFKLERFQPFDLAWGSDDATWIKLGKRKGIKIINDATVYWRKSTLNITPNNKDLVLLERKFNSLIEFSRWIACEAKMNQIEIELKELKDQLESRFLRTVKDKSSFLSFKLISVILT
jgi:glycosyltransferase involved in cell wall biosynthesis